MTLERLDWDRAPSFKPGKLDRLREARYQTEIADALFAQTRPRLAAAVICYDVTNTHLTGSPASNLARFGRSKPQRHDCPLVTLALATDSHGFPRRSNVLRGKVSEPDTLRDALASLTTADDAGQPSVILDAGIGTDDNLTYRRETGHHWITVDRSPLAPAPAAIPAPAPETVVATKV